MAPTTKIGKDGRVLIPASIRRRLHLEAGSLVLIEETPDGLAIRPAVADVELYSPARKAQLLLENAVDDADYRRAVEEVRKLGFDPSRIPHQRP